MDVKLITDGTAEPGSYKWLQSKLNNSVVFRENNSYFVASRLAYNNRSSKTTDQFKTLFNIVPLNNAQVPSPTSLNFLDEKLFIQLLHPDSYYGVMLTRNALGLFNDFLKTVIRSVKENYGADNQLPVEPIEILIKRSKK